MALSERWRGPCVILRTQLAKERLWRFPVTSWKLFAGILFFPQALEVRWFLMRLQRRRPYWFLIMPDRVIPTGKYSLGKPWLWDNYWFAQKKEKEPPRCSLEMVFLKASCPRVPHVVIARRPSEPPSPAAAPRQAHPLSQVQPPHCLKLNDVWISAHSVFEDKHHR